jgi:hypothetical protein
VEPKVPNTDSAIALQHLLLSRVGDVAERRSQKEPCHQPMSGACAAYVVSEGAQVHVPEVAVFPLL